MHVERLLKGYDPGRRFAVCIGFSEQVWYSSPANRHLYFKAFKDGQRWGGGRACRLFGAKRNPEGRFLFMPPKSGFSATYRQGPSFFTEVSRRNGCGGYLEPLASACATKRVQSPCARSSTRPQARQTFPRLPQCIKEEPGLSPLQLGDWLVSLEKTRFAENKTANR